MIKGEIFESGKHSTGQMRRPRVGEENLAFIAKKINHRSNQKPGAVHIWQWVLKEKKVKFFIDIDQIYNQDC